MYDIRQFKPALYVLLMLGFSGFAMAAQSPGLWVLAAGATLLNAWLITTGRFRPLPHMIASAVTLLAVVYIGGLIVHAIASPILIIGEFLVFLQLIKLYEQR